MIRSNFSIAYCLNFILKCPVKDLSKRNPLLDTLYSIHSELANEYKFKILDLVERTKRLPVV